MRMLQRLLSIPFIQYLKNNHGRYLSNLSSTFISQAVTALSILLLTPVLMQQLGIERFGAYGVLSNVIIFSSIFDFGLNIGLLRSLIHDKTEQVVLINSMFFFFAGVFAVSAPLYYLVFSNGILKGPHDLPVISLLIALIVIQNILGVLFDVIIQSVNKIFVGKMIRIVRTTIEFVALFFACRLKSVPVLLLVTATVNFFYLIALFLYSKKEVQYQLSWHYFKFQVLVKHVRYSFWYFQNALASVLVYNAQAIMMGGLLNSADVTRYLLVTRFYEIIRTGLSNFTMVLFPSLSAMQARGDWKELQKTFFRVFLRVTLMVVVAFSILLTVGQYFFVYWSKSNDEVTTHMFQVYSILVALLIIEHVPTVFLSALKFNKLPAIVSTIQGVLGLALSYVLLPRYGVIGVVFGSLSAFLVTSFLFNPLYLLRSIRLYSGDDRR
jgi:O-antigen/teichoic acid export membrane protein